MPTFSRGFYNLDGERAIESDAPLATYQIEQIKDDDGKVIWGPHIHVIKRWPAEVLRDSNNVLWRVSNEKLWQNLLRACP